MAVKSTSRIPQLKEQLTREVDRLVFRIAHQIRNEAIRLIQQGTKSGRIYVRGGIRHQASAPGEAPATDTGNLVRSIRVDHQPASGRASVVVGAEYGAELEFGTRKMAPRPFLRPAVANVRQKIPELVKSISVKVGK